MTDWSYDEDARTWRPPPGVGPHLHGRDELSGIWEPGDLKWTARATPTTGWLLADGSLKLRVDFPLLFEAIGFSYSPTPGADPGGGQFYVPNIQGRVMVMRDPAQTEFDTLGETGGSKTSTAPHTHSQSAHTHQFGHTHGTDTVDTNHAHNVYARDFWVGTMNVNWSHWHPAHIGNMHWNGTQAHGHHDRAQVASEAPWEGANWAGTVPVNVEARDLNHQHNGNHDHPSTNWNAESPWPGNRIHGHSTNSQSTSTSGGPSNDTSGASSAGATSGNLQPYAVVNCFVKT